MKIQDIIKNSKNKNQFTVIEDDENAILLFEGKTVMAGTHEDFHCGKDEAWFDAQLISKKWKNPDSLAQICLNILLQKNIKGKVIDFTLEDNEIFDYCIKNNLWASDESFLNEKIK